jgi:hypothetical protein
MANIGKWNTPTAIASQLTTELNSLANGSMTAASAAYDNSANLNIYFTAELNLASLSPAAGAYLAVYALLAPDGSNYPAQSDADLRLIASMLWCVIPIGTTASTAQRVSSVAPLILPPSLVKFKVDNQSGVSLNASGNTLKILAYNINGNG